MNTELERVVRELKDRNDIWDCLMRYSLGVDRLDRAALESVYHPDAHDDHGWIAGTAAAFIDWVLAYHGKAQHRTQHVINNFRCDLAGDVAHVETYWTYFAVNIEKPHHVIYAGRYIDRFERRNGEWRIADRICVLTTTGNDREDPDGLAGDMFYAPTARDTTDVAYMRPLHVDPARFTTSPQVAGNE